MLDTNVLVSALLRPDSVPGAVLALLLEPEFEFDLCLSPLIFQEYGAVLRRPHLQFELDQIETTLAAIQTTSIWVEPTLRVEACVDPDDDRFLECAQAASAEFLVTGNSRHFPAFWLGTRVVTPRQFLEEAQKPPLLQ